MEGAGKDETKEERLRANKRMPDGRPALFYWMSDIRGIDVEETLDGYRCKPCFDWAWGNCREAKHCRFQHAKENNRLWKGYESVKGQGKGKPGWF